MFNFNNLVNKIITEQIPANLNQQQTGNSNTSKITDILKNDPNSKFPDLVQAYNNKFNSNIDPSAIEPFLQLISAPGYFAGKTLESAGGYTFIPFYDAFLQILTDLRQSSNNPKADFLALKDAFTQSSSIGVKSFEAIIDNINKTEDSNVESYVPVYGPLLKAKGVLDDQVNKLGQVAMSELHNNSILTAIEKIVAKRTNVVNRISHLKGIKRPFSKTLIQPLFYSYKSFVSSTPGNLFAGLYGGWQKKISGDFQTAVDDLTSNKIMTIAILTAEYYKYLLNKILASSTEQNEQQPVNASLTYFNKFVGDILNEVTVGSTVGYRSNYDNIFKNKQQQSQNNSQQNTQQIDKKEIQEMINMTGDQKFVDYQNFLEKGVGRYFGENIYNLGKIDEEARSGVKPAKALYDAIGDIAFYTRKSIGANKTLQAIGSLRVGMGPVN
jgi:hypothetical protein